MNKFAQIAFPEQPAPRSSCSAYRCWRLAIRCVKIAESAPIQTEGRWNLPIPACSSRVGRIPAA